MADLGTVVARDQDTVLEVGDYAIVGTIPCPPTGPTVPTTGQIWPRGQGS